MHAMLNRLNTDDQCTIHFDMSRDDFLTLFTQQNINRAEVLGIRLYSGARPLSLSLNHRIAFTCCFILYLNK